MMENRKKDGKRRQEREEGKVNGKEKREEHGKDWGDKGTHMS
jgi:hypothetical protein